MRRPPLVRSTAGQRAILSVMSVEDAGSADRRAPAAGIEKAVSTIAATASRVTSRLTITEGAMLNTKTGGDGLPAFLSFSRSSQQDDHGTADERRGSTGRPRGWVHLEPPRWAQPREPDSQPGCRSSTQMSAR